MTDRKQDILRLLGVLERSDTFHGHTFQARAYTKVMGQIKELLAVRTMSDVAGVKGVGKEIKLKIETILATGTLPSAEQAAANPQFAAYDALLRVYGVGPVKARSLIDAGIMTIEALRTESARNPKLLTAAQKLGLQYYEDTLERIPRAEMMEHETVLRRAFGAAGLEMQVVGSYRRGLASSGDIDCLVTGAGDKTVMQATFRSVVERLIADGYIVGVLARGDAKTLAYSTVGNGKARRLDLLLTAPAEYAYAVLYFTGSDLFNIAMRAWALERGYTMNEHGMTPVSTASGMTPVSPTTSTMTPTSPTMPAAPVMRSEEDIFAFLGLQYVAPTARVNAEQIVAASCAVVAPVTVVATSPTKKLKLKTKAPVMEVPETPVEEPIEPRKSIKLKLKKLKTE